MMTDTRSTSAARWFTFPRIFVALSLLLGLAMLLVTPPFEVPDEPHHFLRAYQISQGQLLPIFHNGVGGDFLPASIQTISSPFDRLFKRRPVATLDEIRSLLAVPLQPDQKIYSPFPNTSAYSPLVYVPQVMAILVGRFARMTPLEIMYLGRLANLLLWTATGLIALKLAPSIRRPLFLLMLMPMALYQAASMSADVVGNVLAILFCAIIWNQSAEPAASARMTTGRAWLLILLAAGIGLAKFVYVPLTLLSALIPTTAFRSRHAKRLFIAVVIGAALVTSIGWAHQTPGLDMIANGVDKEYWPRLQLLHLKQQPSAWITVPWHTLQNSWREQLTSFVGKFGWMNTPINPLICIAYCLALVWQCRPSLPDPVIPHLGKWLCIIPIVVFSCVFALGLTAYLYWNTTAAPEIIGLQGRYYIPLAPAVIMLIACIWRKKIKWLSLPERAKFRAELNCALIAAAATIYSLHVIFVRFWRP
jgi:uncharacterized membrane protein